MCAASSQYDNSFPCPRTQAPGKTSVKISADDWLCQSSRNLNMTWTEGYPSHSTDASGLCKDQFVKVPHTQGWYDLHLKKKDFSGSKVI